MPVGADVGWGPGATGSSWVRPTAAAVLFTLCLVPAWVGVLQGLAPERRAAAAVVGAAYALACVVAVPLVHRAARPARIGTCAVLLGTGVGLVALAGLEDSWALLPALGIVAALLPIAVTAAVTAVTAGVLLALAAAEGSLTVQLPNVVVLVAVTAAAALVVALVEVNADLHEARGRLAVLAVVDERERIARDLHDVLGHSLTAVALKTGLARRVLEAGDPERAAEQIGDVERLVQQSLTDLRATVSDYREITLVTELAVAAEVLRAAGITAELPAATDAVDPALQGMFGFVLREAVTNVLRHGSARHVVVRLTGTSLSVADDGPAGPPAPRGHGLRGMEERMTAVGGALEAGPGPDGGFVVRASGPATPSPAGGAPT